MTEGFQVKQNGDVFEVRCHKCEARWSNAEDEWPTKLLEHAMQHFEEQRNATHRTARDHWKFSLG